MNLTMNIVNIFNLPTEVVMMWIIIFFTFIIIIYIIYDSTKNVPNKSSMIKYIKSL